MGGQKMNYYADFEKIYKKIIPRRRTDNSHNIDLAIQLKNRLISSEYSLRSNLEQSMIVYQKPEEIIITDPEGEFLRSTMYYNWFYRSDLYGKIKLNSKYCSYCMISPVQALDHFFNKEEHPELAISTLNLIPTCSTCNTRKLQKSIYVHPYYEDISISNWLKCDISWNGNLPIPNFSIEFPEEDMSRDTYDRLCKQLEPTDFFITISEEAVEDIRSNWKGWKDIPEGLIESIMTRYKEGRKETFGINSWQFKLYEALLDDILIFVNKLKI